MENNERKKEEMHFQEAIQLNPWLCEEIKGRGKIELIWAWVCIASSWCSEHWINSQDRVSNPGLYSKQLGPGIRKSHVIQHHQTRSLPLTSCVRQLFHISLWCHWKSYADVSSSDEYSHIDSICQILWYAPKCVCRRFEARVPRITFCICH